MAKEFELKEVNYEFISKLVDKYCLTAEEIESGADGTYTKDELIDCYCEYEGKYITCYNSNGDCFIDEHSDFGAMLIFDQLEG